MTQAGNVEVKRIGIIGCGLIADTHVEAILAAVPDAEIYVADSLPGKAELLRAKYKLRKSYTDVSEMLAEAQPAAVHVLSPPRRHVQHAVQCIEAGCHVLVEKPLCFTFAEAQELYELARREGVKICVDHSLLFQPSVLRFRRLLRERGAPTILQMDSYYGLDVDDVGGSSIAPNHWKEAIPGGALMDSLVHPISLAVGLTGMPCDLVVSRVSSPGAEQLKVMWKTQTAVITLAVSQGAQPFRRITHFVTSGLTCVVDHSTEVLAVLGQGFGPRSLRKIATNMSLGFQFAWGTIRTVWNVARRKLQQNPGARALVAAFYQHLRGEAENPTPERTVLETTMALERTAALLEAENSTDHSLQSPASGAVLDVNQKPSRTVLLTGASGFLGRMLCTKLAHEGNRRVLAQVRRGANADKIPESKFLSKRYIDFDEFSTEDFRQLVEGVDEVVHCAHAAGAKTWDDYERRNVAHSLALYEAAAAAACKRFVHISSLAVYGVRFRRGKPLDEDSPLGMGASRWDFYIRSKARAEQMLTERAVRGGPPLLILRLGILYSAAGERLLAKSFPSKNGRLFICIGSGQNSLPYTRVDCVADQITRSLDMTPFPEGVFNMAGDQSEPWKDFLVRRCRPLGIQCRFLHIPAFPMWAGGWFLESLYALTGRERPPKLTRYIVDSATRNLFYDCSKAKEQLGWDAREACSV